MVFELFTFAELPLHFDYLLFLFIRRDSFSHLNRLALILYFTISLRNHSTQLFLLLFSSHPIF